jgi:D-alanyl-D-alanine carboxypeptidase (penicillin-binding protein 5/6)
MGAPNPDVRIQSSRTLLEYGFRFFETHKLFKKNETISNANVYGGDKTEIKFGVKKDRSITIPRRQKQNLKYQYVIDRKLTAPIKQNETIGFMHVKLNDEILQTYKLTALENVNQGSLYRRTVDSLLMDL